MTYSQHARARRLLAEEHLGAPRRAVQLAAIQAEEAQIEATKAAIRRFTPKAEVA